MGEPYRGISDILNGLSGGAIHCGYEHPPEYWVRKGALEAEAWAQFGRILYNNDTEVIKMLSEVFPNFEKCAMIMLKEVT